MGLYFQKCIKCGNITWFCSVSPISSGGTPCKCGDKYQKLCDSTGKLLRLRYK